MRADVSVAHQRRAAALAIRLRRSAALAVAGTALIAGCADFGGIAPRSRMVEPSAVGLQADLPAQDWPADAWWRAYGDAALDALVERALADGPSVASAAARLERAAGAVASAEAARGPQTGASVDTTRQRYTENGLIPPPRAGSVASTNTAQLTFAWELDLFGRQRSALDAAVGRSRAAQADLQAARILVAAQVVRGYFELARLQQQQALARRTLAHREETVALVRQRVDAGLETRVALRMAEAGPPEIRRLLAALDEQASLARNALAALTAQPPSALAALSATLPARSTVRAPATLPADLLGRRADIVAARWRVEASLRQRDAATALFYPNVNLAAFAGLSSIGVGRWFDSGSLVYGAGPAIRLPLFDAGRLRANLREQTAEIDVAVGDYNAAIVGAVREVADHVASLQSLAQQAQAHSDSTAADEAALALAQARYRAGLGNYLTVLTAQSSVLAKQTLTVDLRARALDLDAGLARALGGGFAGESLAAR